MATAGTVRRRRTTSRHPLNIEPERPKRLTRGRIRSDLQQLRENMEGGTPLEPPAVVRPRFARTEPSPTPLPTVRSARNTGLFPPFKTKEEIEAEALGAKPEALFSPAELSKAAEAVEVEPPRVKRTGSLSTPDIVKIFEKAGLKYGDARLLFGELYQQVADAIDRGEVDSNQVRQLHTILRYALEQRQKKEGVGAMKVLRDEYNEALHAVSPALYGKQPNAQKFLDALLEELTTRVAPGMPPPPIPPVVFGKKKMRRAGAPTREELLSAAVQPRREELLRTAVGVPEVQLPQLPAQLDKTSMLFVQAGVAPDEIDLLFPHGELKQAVTTALQNNSIDKAKLLKLCTSLTKVMRDPRGASLKARYATYAKDASKMEANAALDHLIHKTKLIESLTQATLGDIFKNAGFKPDEAALVFPNASLSVPLAHAVHFEELSPRRVTQLRDLITAAKANGANLQTDYYAHHGEAERLLREVGPYTAMDFLISKATGLSPQRQRVATPPATPAPRGSPLPPAPPRRGSPPFPPAALPPMLTPGWPPKSVPSSTSPRSIDELIAEGARAEGARLGAELERQKRALLGSEPTSPIPVPAPRGTTSSFPVDLGKLPPAVSTRRGPPPLPSLTPTPAPAMRSHPVSKPVFSDTEDGFYNAKGFLARAHAYNVRPAFTLDRSLVVPLANAVKSGQLPVDQLRQLVEAHKKWVGDIPRGHGDDFIERFVDANTNGALPLLQRGNPQGAVQHLIEWFKANSPIAPQSPAQKPPRATTPKPTPALRGDVSALLSDLRVPTPKPTPAHQRVFHLPASLDSPTFTPAPEPAAPHVPTPKPSPVPRLPTPQPAPAQRKPSPIFEIYDDLPPSPTRVPIPAPAAAPKPPALVTKVDQVLTRAGFMSPEAEFNAVFPTPQLQKLAIEAINAGKVKPEELGHLRDAVILGQEHGAVFDSHYSAAVTHAERQATNGNFAHAIETLRRRALQTPALAAVKGTIQPRAPPLPGAQTPQSRQLAPFPEVVEPSRATRPVPTPAAPPVSPQQPAPAKGEESYDLTKGYPNSNAMFPSNELHVAVSRAISHGQLRPSMVEELSNAVKELETHPDAANLMRQYKEEESWLSQHSAAKAAVRTLLDKAMQLRGPPPVPTSPPVEKLRDQRLPPTAPADKFDKATSGWLADGQAASDAAGKVTRGERHEESVVMDIRKVQGYRSEVEEPRRGKLSQAFDSNVPKVGFARRLFTRRPQGAFEAITGEHGNVAPSHVTISKDDDRILLHPAGDVPIQLSKAAGIKEPMEISTATSRSRGYPEFSLVSGNMAQVYNGNSVRVGNNTFKVVKVAGEVKLVGVDGPVQDKEFIIGTKPVTIGADPRLSHIALIAAAVAAGKKGK